MARTWKVAVASYIYSRDNAVEWSCKLLYLPFIIAVAEMQDFRDNAKEMADCAAREGS